MIRLTVIASAIVFMASFSADKGQKIKLPYPDAAITVVLPQGFTPLEEGLIAEKYPAAKKADAVYSTKDLDVDFAFNVTRTSWPDNNIQMFGKFNKATIMSIYDKVVFAKDTVVEIDKRKFLIYEFDAVAKGEFKLEENQTKAPLKQYYYLAYTFHNKKVLLFNFNCHQKLKKKWKNDAAKIINSIRFSAL